MCGLTSTRLAVVGSSSTACTASNWCCQAATGSSSTEGPGGSRTPLPAARKSGNHSTRWRTTSRAVQPATGAGTVQSRVPRTRSEKAPAFRRCRSAAVSDGAIGEHPIQLGVALVDADLHATAQPGVAALDAVDQGLGVQPGAAVAEVLERHGLQRDALRHALPGEGLHDALRADLVEASVEAVLLAFVDVQEAPTAAGARVPVVDGGAHRVGADPLPIDLGVGVCAEQLLGSGGEVPGHPDDGQGRVGLDGGLG